MGDPKPKVSPTGSTSHEHLGDPSQSRPADEGIPTGMQCRRQGGSGRKGLGWGTHCLFI